LNIVSLATETEKIKVGKQAGQKEQKTGEHPKLSETEDHSKVGVMLILLGLQASINGRWRSVHRLNKTFNWLSF